jgi:hypothetical protein
MAAGGDDIRPPERDRCRRPVATTSAIASSPGHGETHHDDQTPSRRPAAAVVAGPGRTRAGRDIGRCRPTAVNTAASTPAAPAPDALQQQFVEIVKQVGPSVVLVKSNQGLKRGDIVTNDHVVAGRKNFQVVVADGRQFAATVVGTFAPGDLAVLHVNAQGVKPAAFADSTYLGVQSATTTCGGPVVTEVQSGGPAARAGIQAGDLITVISDTSTPGQASVADVLAGLNPGETVTLVIVHHPDGAKQDGSRDSRPLPRLTERNGVMERRTPAPAGHPRPGTGPAGPASRPCPAPPWPRAMTGTPYCHGRGKSTHEKENPMATLAFLGLGQMGTPMAARLPEAGHNVTVWNRTRVKTQPPSTRARRQQHRPTPSPAWTPCSPCWRIRRRSSRYSSPPTAWSGGSAQGNGLVRIGRRDGRI